MLIELPKDIEARLEALSAATGRTKSFYALEAILEHLDDLENFYLAEQRLIGLLQGKTETRTLETAMKNHGLEDYVRRLG